MFHRSPKRTPRCYDLLFLQGISKLTWSPPRVHNNCAIPMSIFETKLTLKIAGIGHHCGKLFELFQCWRHFLFFCFWHSDGNWSAALYIPVFGGRNFLRGLGILILMLGTHGSLPSTLLARFDQFSWRSCEWTLLFTSCMAYVYKIPYQFNNFSISFCFIIMTLPVCIKPKYGMFFVSAFYDIILAQQKCVLMKLYPI